MDKGRKSPELREEDARIGIEKETAKGSPRRERGRGEERASGGEKNFARASKSRTVTKVGERWKEERGRVREGR